MNRALVLIAVALLAACAKPEPSPVAAESTCPATLPDVDRLACWLAAGPVVAPDAHKHSALLRNADGSSVIGSKSSP
jgi:hypothetical protein